MIPVILAAGLVIMNYLAVIQAVPSPVDLTVDCGRDDARPYLQDGFAVIPSARYPNVIETYIASPAGTVVIPLESSQRYRLRVKLRVQEPHQVVTIALNGIELGQVAGATPHQAQKASFVLGAAVVRHGSNRLTFLPVGGTRPPILEDFSIRNFWGHLKSGDGAIFLTAPKVSAIPWQAAWWWVVAWVLIGVGIWGMARVTSLRWQLCLWLIPQVLLSLAWMTMAALGFALALSSRLFWGLTVVLPCGYLATRFLAVVIIVGMRRVRTLQRLYEAHPPVAVQPVVRKTAGWFVAGLSKLPWLCKTAWLWLRKTAGWLKAIGLVALARLMQAWRWLWQDALSKGFVIFAWLMLVAYGLVLVGWHASAKTIVDIAFECLTVGLILGVIQAAGSSHNAWRRHVG